MTVFELMSRLGAAGVKLWVEEGQLKFKAPKGALTPELKEVLVAKKQDVIDFLSGTRISSGDDGDAIPVADRSKPVHLSHAQNRLWFIEQLTPGNSTFHIPAPLYLKGILDHAALERAFLALLKRHEALRTVFRTVNDEPMQIVQPVERFSVPVEDLCDLDPDQRDSEVRKKIEREIRLPFDLEHGPMLRARLYKLDDNQYGLIVVMHHIVTDGWSMGVFVREIAALYAAERMGMSSPLPQLDIQYGDFAEWQRNWLQGDVLERQLNYWRKQLAAAPEELMLPFDRPRPAMQTSNGAVLDINLDGEVAAQVKQVARQFDTTVYVVLLAAFKVLLARWSRQKDICVGMPVAGRTRPEVENLIGFFVNTLVIRTHQEHKPSFAEFVAQVKEQVLGAQSHQDVPFEAIVEDLNIPRNLSFAPVYQVALSLTSSEGTAQKAVLGGLEIEPMQVELIAARLDLTMMLADYGDHIAGMLEYNTDLFDASTMATFASQFQRLLTALTAETSVCVDSVPLLSDAELRDVLKLGEEAQAVLPLAPMQRDFCLDSLREPDTNRNSIGDAIEIPFAVDVDRLHSALQQVANDNPLLRVRIVEGNRPWLEPLYQVIEANHSVYFQVQDWRSQSLSIQEVEHKLEQLVLQSWDVLEGNLIRHYLIYGPDERTYYVTSAHHSIFDGVSKRNHVLDVLNAYFGRPTASTSIGEITRWVYERSGKTDNALVLDYWRKELSLSEPVGNRSAHPGRAIVQHWGLYKHDYQELQDWCKTRGISLANYLRTLYALALQICHYQDNRIVLIDAIAGRGGSLDDALGCFFQFVPFVQQTGPEINTFSELLQANRMWRKQMGDACYLSMLARKQFLNPDALEFQFNFRLPKVTDSFHYDDYLMSVLAIQPDNAGTVKLLVTPHDELLDVRFSFREHDFAGYHLLKRMEQVHGQIMGGQEVLSQLDWLFEEERAQLSQLPMQVGGETAIEKETVLDLIAAQIDRTPESCAVICGERTQSYAELDALSNQVARWLNQQGIGRGQRVALCLGRGLLLPAMYLGVIKSGAAYVPMDAAYPADRIAYILGDSQAPVLITERCVLERMQQDATDALGQVSVLVLEDIQVELENCSARPLEQLPSADDVLYYVYTSGSTGRPKGAGVYHRGERNLLEWYRHLLKLDVHDRVLLISALGFDLTQKNLFVPFCSGAALVLPDFEDYDPDQLADLVGREKISVVNCAPSAFYPLVEQTKHSAYPFSSLRHVVLGGEPIRLGSLKPWFDNADVHCVLTNSYGPTECTDVVAFYSLHEIPDPSVPMPIGHALPNTRLFVVDHQARLMPSGAVGELCVAGVGVGTGYLDRPDLNAQSFQLCPYSEGNWYRTGDLVRFNEHGEIVYVGRKDFQVKLRGLRIEPGEIDSILKTLPLVRDALSLVVDERLVSYVIAPRSFDIAAAKDALRKQLPEFMVPGTLVLLDAWPLTPNGKIDRKALPQPDHDDLGPYIAPRNDSEQRIADIWCQVLKQPKISVTANFFEVGGHSLLATQVVSRIRQAFGVELSVRALFESPSIEKLTRIISGAAAAGMVDSAPPIVPLDPPNRDTLSFAQYRLWFVDQLNQGSSEYNLPSALRVKGPLDIEVLDRVFGEIVKRHEVLRTNFAEHEGVPQLIVHEPAIWHSTVIDLSGLDDASRQKEVQRLVDEDANVTFGLAEDSLFTTRVLKLADDEHILLLNMHHIISDGWSIGVMVQEIQALYMAFVAGRSSPLPPLPIQYSDFAVWQRNWLQGETLDKLRTYWQKTLRGAPDVLRLPTDKPRPKIQTFNGAHFPLSLGRELSAQVNQFCEQHDLTPFMVLMGAYHVLLSRYSGQKDICVGIPIAGRNRAEIEGLIGFFINGLVIRSRLDANPSVQQYFKQMKEVALGAYAHQDMPADLLLDAMKMERSADTSPGAQVGFALQNVAQTDLNTDMAGLAIEAVQREHKTAKYELSLILQENGGEIAGVAEYNTDLFQADTIGRMMIHYRHILEQMLAQPDQMLDAIQVVELDQLYSLLEQDPAECELRRLSPMQRDMYLDTLLDPNTLKNSLGYHFITAGEFDLALWQRASQQLVDTQPLLRARILPSDIPYTDVAYLRVANHDQLQIHYEDWSDRVTSDADAAAFAQNKIWQPYDVHGPLTEYFVYKLDAGRHLVIFRANHILLDGAGMAVHLLNSIDAAQCLKTGQPYQPAPTVFPDYVSDNLRRTDTTEVIAHWREAGKTVEALDFPLPPQYKTEAPGVRMERQLRLDDNHWRQVQDFCRQERITPSLYFKALYGLLINAYCRGESDFVVSEVVAGRNGVHKRAFGNYFQVLPVLFPQDLFAPGHDVEDLFGYIRNYRKSLRSNANVSLLTQRHTLPQGRLHFMFNYYNFIPSVELFGTAVQLKAYPQVQDGPVQFVVHEQDGWIELNLIYLSDLFADLRFLERIESLSRQVLQGTQSVDALELVLADEKRQQLDEWNSTVQTLPPFESIVPWFDQQVERTPDHIAVKRGSEQLSFRQLQQQANRLGNWLLAQGLEKGQRIGICVDRSPSALVAVLGVLKAGGVYVPMDSRYPAERLAYMLEDSEATLLLTQACVLQRLQEAEANLGETRVVLLDENPEYLDAPDSMPAVQLHGDDPLYVIYTSGSTGKPKGAVVKHAGEVNLQHWYIQSLQLTETDRFLLISAFGFDLTQKNLFAPLLTGGTLVMPEMDDYDVEAISGALMADSITVVNCAPSAFYPLVETEGQPGFPFSSLRYLVLGGEPIRMGALRRWLEQPGCRCKVVNSYGPTECTDVVSFYINQDAAADVLPIGKPVCNTQLYVVNDSGHLLPDGVVGELCVGGDGVGLGYLDRPELNETLFQPNPFGPGQWYRTGDLVRYWQDGNIEYIGRKDFQIKLRGLRIELGEIEHALRQQPFVQDSLTLVRDDQLVTYVIAPHDFDIQACRTRLRQNLPDYMVPQSVVVLSQWPLTPNGKIDRNALPSPDESSGAPYVAPRNETEEKLVAIWSEVLGVDRIGIHDSFFDLGGHSLLAARAVSKFRQAFDVDIPLRALFELHTVADIAQYLETLKWAAQAAEQAQAEPVSGEARDEGFL